MARRSSKVRVVLGLVASLVLGPGCESRAPEPGPPPKVGPDSAEPATASTGTASPSRPTTGRCIKPTPDSPKRQVVGPVPNPACPNDDWPKFELPMGVVHFPDQDGKPLEVAVEIAAKGKEREKGLMFRKSMNDDAGMLFVFEEERELSFWMENTCIPLDMIFIASDGTIVGIEENTPTLSRDTFSPGCAAKYVLEVNAGWARKHGVRAGTTVRLPTSV